MHSQEMQSGLFIQAADFPETSAGPTGTQLRHIHTLCPCSPHYHGFTALYLPAPATLPCGTRGWARAPGETMAPGPYSGPLWRLDIHFTGPAAPVSILGAPHLGAGPPPAQTRKDNSGASVVKPTCSAGRLGNHLHTVTGRCQGKICSPVTETINTHPCTDTQRAQFNY